MKNLIIEGLSGSGKSKLIREITTILKNDNIPHKIYSEEETFGDFMDDLNNLTMNESQKCYRLNEVIEKIKTENKDNLLILERFHLSYYALLPKWRLYRKVDKFLSNNDFLMVLLNYDKSLIVERAINHFDMKAKVANPLDTMISYFGSKEKTIQAYEKSQSKRLEGLKKTKINTIEIDTSNMNWAEYAKIIISRII